MTPKTIIVGVTGSIAAYRACEIVSALKKSLFDVKVILTKEGANFITPLTLQALSGNKVFTDMFEPPQKWEPVHTSLADSASLVLIAPATANVIGKLAGGICDDLLTCVVYATKAPILIAPAMNEKMYNHAILQENIAKLKKVGYSFVGPIKGHLACGHDAIGHISCTEDVVKEVKKLVRR
ncbi:MAG: flavoprotein [Candidatus Omnitrophota bacterium]|nr:flavoprotein [Candidatus Omnitrophota bacterium]